MSSQIVFRIVFGVVMLGVAIFAGCQLKEPVLSRAVSRVAEDWERVTLRHLARWATIFVLALLFLAEVISRDTPVQLAAVIAVPGIVAAVYRRGIRDGRVHSAPNAKPKT
jgi:intracellular septation protein A